MRSNLSAVALLLLLAVCFTLGLVSALLGRSPAPERAPTPTATGYESPQTTVLIIGVDDLQSDVPVLVALWVATYRLPATDVFLLGVPVDFPAASANPSSLSSLFRFSQQEGVSAEFLQAMADIVPVNPDLVIVLDRHAFAALIDYLGGLELNGAHLDGLEVAAALDILAGDPHALLTAQTRVLLAMTPRASLLGASPDITPLLALIPSHIYLSDSVALAIGLASPLLPIDPSRVHFDQLQSHAAPTALSR